MKLLLSGDLHLGRTPTRLPEGWRDEARAVRVFSRLVQTAIDEQVAAVLLSGDLVDQTNRFWESIGPLETGLARLADAGTRVLAVAGNHDADVLPLVAAQLPMLELLGADGHWERVTLEENGTPVLHLDGWSFPRPRVSVDPTESYPSHPADGLPVLAMVHGDLEATHSVYAPLRLSRLRDLPVQGWLLGHLHQPVLHGDAEPWVLMPGSPQPLDPGEPGPHHAWLCEVRDGKLLPPEPAAAAGLRYDRLELGVTADTPPTAGLLHDTLRDHLRTIARVDPLPPGQLVIRLTVSGTCADRDALASALQGLEDWEGREGGIEAVVEPGIVDHTRPDLDPVRLQEGEGVVARLAGLLSGPLPESLQSLLARERDALDRMPEFNGRDLPPLEKDPDALRQAASRLLDQLVRETGA